MSPGSPPLRVEDIFEHAPFPAAHASTIVETEAGLVAAWFAGTREGHGDVGIWVARHEHGHWLHPIEVANGRIAFRRRYPCWNPVLFQPKGEPLLLFYKLGPSPSRWWGMLLTSDDAGCSWSEPRRLPKGILGPIKNKPIVLSDGRVLCPSSDEDGRWRLHLEWTDVAAKMWRREAAAERRPHLRGDPADGAGSCRRPIAAALPHAAGDDRRVLVE